MHSEDDEVEGNTSNTNSAPPLTSEAKSDFLDNNFDNVVRRDQDNNDSQLGDRSLSTAFGRKTSFKIHSKVDGHTFLKLRMIRIILLV